MTTKMLLLILFGFLQFLLLAAVSSVAPSGSSVAISASSTVSAARVFDGITISTSPSSPAATTSSAVYGGSLSSTRAFPEHDAPSNSSYSKDHGEKLGYWCRDEQLRRFDIFAIAWSAFLAAQGAAWAFPEMFGQTRLLYKVLVLVFNILAWAVEAYLVSLQMHCAKEAKYDLLVIKNIINISFTRLLPVLIAALKLWQACKKRSRQKQGLDELKGMDLFKALLMDCWWVLFWPLMAIYFLGLKVLGREQPKAAEPKVSKSDAQKRRERRERAAQRNTSEMENAMDAMDYIH